MTKREYTIIIEAPARQQPSQEDIYREVNTLVRNRAREFPKDGSRRGVTIIPGPVVDLLRKFPKK